MTTTPTRVPRWARRVFELADDDAQLQELMPDDVVLEAVTRPGQSFEQMTSPPRWTATPSVRRWASATTRSCSTRRPGRHRRQYLPRFDTITYYELHNRVKVWPTRGGTTASTVSTPATSCASSGSRGSTTRPSTSRARTPRRSAFPCRPRWRRPTSTASSPTPRPTAVAATMDDLVLAAQFAGAPPVDPQRHRPRLRRARRRRP